MALNRTADVIELLAGRTTVEVIAERHGTSVSEVESWKAIYVAALAAAHSVRAPRWKLATVLVAIASLGVTIKATDALAQTCSYAGLPAGLRVMCADAPARADDVNFNNTLMATWLAQKVGPVGTPVVTVNSDLGANANVSIPTGSLNFGTTKRQMINLWGAADAIGVQDFLLYNRSEEGFAWYKGGAHSNTRSNPGNGGARLMELDSQNFFLNSGDAINGIRLHFNLPSGNLAITGDLSAPGNQHSECYDMPDTCGYSGCNQGAYVVGITVNANEQCGGTSNDLDFGNYHVRCCKL